MKYLKTTLTVCFLLASLQNHFALAQETKQVASPYRYDDISLGLGIGLDKGIIGGQIIAYPQKNIGLLIGCGYSSVGFAYNAGLKLRYTNDRPYTALSPFLLGIYGVNAVINIKGATAYNSYVRQFRGYTLGLGTDIRFRPAKIGYISFALMFPFVTERYSEYLYYMRQVKGSAYEGREISVRISLGYTFMLHNFVK